MLAISGKELVISGAFVPLADFYAGNSGLRGGVHLIAKDLDGDGHADLVIGSGDTQDLSEYSGADLISGSMMPDHSLEVPVVIGGVNVG